ncbi:hypothetical protein IGI04_032395, partial [Brassica rapa subsp. trilocularis]
MDHGGWTNKDRKREINSEHNAHYSVISCESTTVPETRDECLINKSQHKNKPKKNVAQPFKERLREEPQNIDLEIRHAFLGRFILDWVHWPQRKESKRLPEEGPYVISDYLPPRSLHCVSVRQSHASYSLVLSTARNHIS